MGCRFASTCPSGSESSQGVLAGLLDCRSRWAARGPPSSGEQPARLGRSSERAQAGSQKRVGRWAEGESPNAPVAAFRLSEAESLRNEQLEPASLASRALCTPEPTVRGTCESKARAKRSRGGTHRRKAPWTLGSGSGGALLAERGLRGTRNSLIRNSGAPRRASGMARAAGRRRRDRLVRSTGGVTKRRQWKVATGSCFG